MIEISDRALLQIKHSVDESDADGLCLRIAARRLEDGSFDYAMGFDQSDHNDTLTRVRGIDVVIGPTSIEFLKDAKLDYVEMEDGEYRFIFMNPNDPTHVPPQEES